MYNPKKKKVILHISLTLN